MLVCARCKTPIEPGETECSLCGSTDFIDNAKQAPRPNNNQQRPNNGQRRPNNGQRRPNNGPRPNNPVNQYNNAVDDDGSSVKDWLITMLCMIIPILNLKVIFGTMKDDSAPQYKRTYMTAFLIYFAVMTIVSFLIAGAIK